MLFLTSNQDMGAIASSKAHVPHVKDQKIAAFRQLLLRVYVHPGAAEGCDLLA
jgi:hypothetical protein